MKALLYFFILTTTVKNPYGEEKRGLLNKSGLPLIIAK